MGRGGWEPGVGGEFPSIFHYVTFYIFEPCSVWPDKNTKLKILFKKKLFFLPSSTSSLNSVEFIFYSTKWKDKDKVLIYCLISFLIFHTHEQCPYPPNPGSEWWKLKLILSLTSWKTASSVFVRRCSEAAVPSAYPLGAFLQNSTWAECVLEHRLSHFQMEGDRYLRKSSFTKDPSSDDLLLVPAF